MCDEGYQKRWDEIAQTFRLIDQFTTAVTKGQTRFLIVSGEAGQGKSYGIFDTLKRWDKHATNYHIIKGFGTAAALYEKLYEYRRKGQVLVLDDSDALFKCPISMNMLKAATDTLPERIISWEIKKKTDGGLPTSFKYEGSIILLTNYNFDTWLEQGGTKKIVDHFRALLDRAQYINIGIESKLDRMIRIMQGIDEGLLGDLTEEQRDDIVEYMDIHSAQLREISMRMAYKLGELVNLFGDKWKQMAPTMYWAK